eukprot:5246523-Pyramimonas_sp.AAC.1
MSSRPGFLFVARLIWIQYFGLNAPRQSCNLVTETLSDDLRSCSYQSGSTRRAAHHPRWIWRWWRAGSPTPFISAVNAYPRPYSWTPWFPNQFTQRPAEGFERSLFPYPPFPGEVAPLRSTA